MVACSCPWETTSVQPLRKVASIFDPSRSHHLPQSIPTFSHGIAHIRVTIMELHLIWHPRCFSHQPIEHWRRLIFSCRTPNQRNVDWGQHLLENVGVHGTSHCNGTDPPGQTLNQMRGGFDIPLEGGLPPSETKPFFCAELVPPLRNSQCQTKLTLTSRRPTAGRCSLGCGLSPQLCQVERTSKKTTPSLRECGDMFAIHFQLSEGGFHCRLWKFLD